MNIFTDKLLFVWFARRLKIFSFIWDEPITIPIIVSNNENKSLALKFGVPWLNDVLSWLAWKIIKSGKYEK